MAVRASAQQTIIDITDAYSVYLTCASYTFPGTTSAAKAGSAKTQVVAMRGTEQVTATVDTSKCEAPTGVTVTSDADATSPTLTVSVTTAVTAPGKVTIPVVVDGGVDFTLEFAYGIALTGAQGVPGTSVKVSSTSVTYQASGSGTTAPTGTWATTVPGVAQGQYLWTKTVVSYSDGKSTTSYSVSRQGVNGSDGADAISMVITSSNGTIFKNARISTTLTAHVYRGGAELSATDVAKLGTIRWYKDGSTTAAATGASMTLTADSVNVKTNVVAQLDGGAPDVVARAEVTLVGLEYVEGAAFDEYRKERSETDDALAQQVSGISETQSGLVESTTSLTQRADGWDASVTRVEAITDQLDGVSQVTREVTDWARLDASDATEPALEIGTTASDFKERLSNRRLRFQYKGDDVLTLDGESSSVSAARVRIGAYEWRPTNGGRNLSLVYVGGES